MSNPEICFLFLITGFPTIAASKVFTDYDRAVARQIVAHLGWLPDDEDREYLASVEDEIVSEDDKYTQKWGT